MKMLNEYIETYKKQLEIGDIQKAYKGLTEYMMSLKTYFANKYADLFHIGHFYQGYMDITYFTFTPESLKKEKLKIGIGFNHEKMQFGIWLSGQNKQIQSKYWEIFKGSDWDRYHIPETIEGNFAIIDYILIENPNFDDLGKLTEEIETKAIKFVDDITEAIN